MQLVYIVPVTAVDYQTFSILGRIGGDATQQFLTIRLRASGLSVSSVGSEAMQLGMGTG